MVRKAVKPQVPAGRGLGLSLPDAIAIACFCASGFLSLTYEICWIRQSSLVFGAATFALSTVLAAFFGGLALGSYLFGRYAPRASRPLRLYAILEISVGALALLSPAAFVAADALYGWSYPLVSHSFELLSLVRFLLLVVIVLPPTVLMGGTLPLFCRQYVVNESRISRPVGLLYGLNTLGAAVGCATTGFFMIPRIGVTTTIYLAATLNILIGLIVWKLLLTGPGLPDPSVRQSPVQPTASTPSFVAAVHALFFLTGFVMLGYEVLWSRFLSLLMHHTVYTYTATLTVILVGIVLGSVVTAGLFDRLRRRALFFGAVQAATGITVLSVLMLPHDWWSRWLNVEGPTGRLWLVIWVLLPPAILSGISFPLGIRMVVEQPAGAAAGVGRMTALNTVGGIAGALATGFLLVPWLGLHATLLLTTGTSLLIGFAAWTLLAPVAPLTRWGLIVLSASVWLAIPFVTGARLPADFLADRRRLVEFREGLSSFVAVVRQEDALVLEIDRLWQGEDQKNHQIMAAHVPMLLHKSPRDILVVGLGSGQTASRFLMYDVERLDCVDIERALFPLVQRHFDSAWMDDERVQLIIEDGRNFLSYTEAKYDVISVEVGQVFRPGVASFYTADFYRRAVRRLKANGLLCQFVPSAYFTPEQFRTIVGTFLDAFPKSVLWYNTAELLLIGTVGDELALTSARLGMLSSHDALHRDLSYAYWGGPAHYLNQLPVFLAGFLAGPAGLARLAAGAPIYRDDRPYLEYDTSPVEARAQEPVTRLIEAHLDPVQTLLDVELDAETTGWSQSIRKKNLDTVVAMSLKRQVSDLANTGRQEEAIDLLRKALARNDENVAMLNSMGNALRSRGELDKAISHYQQAVRIKPDYPEAHNNLGNVLASTGDLDQAIRHYRYALGSRPSFAEAHNNLGTVLALRGAHSEEIRHFRQAVRIRPDYAEAHANLGLAISTGDPLEGLKHLREAIRLRPVWPAPLNRAAWILAAHPDPTVRDAREAVELARRAADLTDHEDPSILVTLAAAYAAASEFERAVTTAQLAIELADAAHRPDLTKTIRGHLELYKRKAQRELRSGSAD